MDVVIGYMILLAAGFCAWWAWPAGRGWQGKFWTGFTAVFLAPFSWPWLIARGSRVRREAKRVRQLVAEREAELLRQGHIQWWLHERATATYEGDLQRQLLAQQTLDALGYSPLLAQQMTQAEVAEAIRQWEQARRNAPGGPIVL